MLFESVVEREMEGRELEGSRKGWERVELSSNIVASGVGDPEGS